ncbi:MAG: hypothetical protein IPK19_24845 [Chloroflexi bacterium]|nr:hypothetical protein [Chloroflexota bacterium]
MSNRRDDFSFDDSDDFFNDDSDPFGDFDDDSGVTGGLGDTIVEDMPDLEEEPDSGGSNRTFVVLAVLLILLFVVGLGVILFLATRDSGPTPVELTSTSIAATNAQVVAFLAETATQDLLNIQMTQTALARPTDTPVPTETPLPTDTPVPTDTPPRPTITPTPTEDPTLLALQTLAADVLTVTANAALTAQVTPPPPPTATPAPPTDTPTLAEPVGLGDLRERFATEVAFATLSGAGRQSELATQQALATQGALENALIAQEILATVAANQQGALSAIDAVNDRLDEIALEREELALALTAVNLENAMTQAALEAPFGAATQAAGATQAAAATLVADLAVQFNDPSLAQPGGIATVIALSTQSAAETQTFFEQQATAGADIVTPAVEATQVSTGTRAALDAQAAVAAQIAAATQAALDAPRAFATQAAIATQVSIATRVALIETALYVSPTPGPTDEIPVTAEPTLPPTSDALAAINLTATAIAAQFQTATASVLTPDAVTLTPGPSPTIGAQQIAPTEPSELPDTGIFDDAFGGSGGGLGGLLLIVVGLVGVLFGARLLRSANRRALDRTPEEPPQNPPQDPPAEQ